jgi:hypothetical protein
MATNPTLLQKFYKKLKEKNSYNFADGHEVKQPCQIKFKHKGVEKVAQSVNIGTKCAPGWTSVSKDGTNKDTCEPNADSTKNGQLPICSKSTVEAWLKTQKEKSNPSPAGQQTSASSTIAKNPSLLTNPPPKPAPQPAPKLPQSSTEVIAPQADHNIVFKTKITPLKDLDEYSAMAIGKEFVDHYLNQFPGKFTKGPESISETGQVKSNYYAIQKLKEGLRLRGQKAFEENYTMDEIRSYDTSEIRSFTPEALTFGERMEVDKGL